MGVVDGVLAGLARKGLLERDADGNVWRRPTTGSAEAVRLSVLAQATIQTIERYYLAIALLLRAGSLDELLAQDSGVLTLILAGVALANLAAALMAMNAAQKIKHPAVNRNCL